MKNQSKYVHGISGEVVTAKPVDKTLHQIVGGRLRQATPGDYLVTDIHGVTEVWARHAFESAFTPAAEEAPPPPAEAAAAAPAEKSGRSKSPRK